MHELTYGSVCSGIEAATVAWHPLGLKAEWFAQFDPEHDYDLGPDFPSLVLAYRWPDVPNLGDMTLLAARIRSGEIPAPAILVGGTPCQAYSIAGKREGLDDPRGALTLAYVELVEAIDEQRKRDGKPPVIVIWENVPGVLTSDDNAYGHFLAGLAGESDPLVAPGQKWSDAGHVIGPARRIAWRVLNAQFFGVAQRRRRVFVIATARNDVDPASVLFEREGVRGNPAPCRGTPEENTAHFEASAGAGSRDITACMAHGQGGAELRLDDLSPTLTCNHESPIVFTFNNDAAGLWRPADVAGTIRAGDKTGNGEARNSTLAVMTFPAHMSGTQTQTQDGSVSQTLTTENPTAVLIQDGDEMYIRRLMPIEYERLQGFPDNYTCIPQRKNAPRKAEDLAFLAQFYPDASEAELRRLAADGPRCKALGNSMAVPVMRWLMDRVIACLPGESKNIDVLPPTKILMTTKKKTKKAKAVKVDAPVYVRPFLKWPGGKYSVLDQLLPHLGEGKRLIEPFVGAGSVFFNAPQFERYLLGDTNRDLIGLYIGAGVANIADTARPWFDGTHNTRDAFEGIRERFNDNKMGMAERASAFLYLNRHTFNGLTRYNKKGRFNSSFGGYKSPYFPDAELAAFKELYPRCDFKCQSFVDTLRLAGAGDVVFCDPPYMPMPDSLGFTSYTKDPFNDDHQWSLLNEMVLAHERGARVVVTNSGAPLIKENYERAGFVLHPLYARRSMSCKGATRGTAADIIGVLA